MTPFVATVWGRPVEGVRRAAGAGIPCLLVHGAGRSHRYLEPLAAALPGPVVVPSLPGRGGSEGAPLESVAEIARWCAALLDALGVGEVRVVGHSLGGGIALEMAIAEARVRALGLVSTGARLRVHPSILETARAAAQGGAPNPFGDDPAVPAATAAVDWGAADAFDRLHDLGRIRAPAWIAVGADDALTPPRYGEYLARHLAGALRVFPGAGHELPTERASELGSWLFGGAAHAERQPG